ncbi:transcription initiation factor IIF, beta subunit-domain-containing protein [Catenaria anguillulae PL171]|uniref:Transcription initiation factor IIF, beta subunit-domain-containing protein n=1 Tax=Catenaria anguillulae PL171 TaxID=765915 RepID=A0A1Y2HK37_9FUNG|nr:transcription initiation factor IIF, beta subunit-domain-containing protein [Catenaria anguillulae PL171]
MSAPAGKATMNHAGLPGKLPSKSAPRPVLDVVKSKSRKAMLVKVPKWLADKWKSHPPAHLLAHMTPTAKHRPQKPEFHIQLADTPENKGLTQKFTLKVSNTNVQNMFAFVESEPGRCAEIEATITSEASLIPVADESYHALARQRADQAAKPKRQVRMLTPDESKKLQNKGALGGPIDPSNLVLAGKQKKVTGEAHRATRTIPVAELKAKLIGMFQMHEYWTMSAVLDKTKQPRAYISEVMPQIAQLVKRGPYANHWTLKTEIKNVLPGASANSTETIGAAASSSGSGAAAGGETATDTEIQQDEDVPMPDVQEGDGEQEGKNGSLAGN